jgi:hypothetical protein
MENLVEISKFKEEGGRKEGRNKNDNCGLLLYLRERNVP